MNAFRLHRRPGALFRPALSAALVPLLAGCGHLNPGLAIGENTLAVPLVRQEGPETCGSAALTSVLLHWGVDTTREELREQLGEPPKYGYHLNQLQAVAESFGLDTVLFRGTREDLRLQTVKGRPCVIVVHSGPDLNHCLVVTSVRPRGLEVLDPARGKAQFRRWETLETSWTMLGSPILLVVRTAPNPIPS